MLALPLLYLLIFKYVPMAYVLIAFKEYSIVQSLWEMPWADKAGFQYFIRHFPTEIFSGLCAIPWF